MIRRWFVIPVLFLAVAACTKTPVAEKPAAPTVPAPTMSPPGSVIWGQRFKEMSDQNRARMHSAAESFARLSESDAAGRLKICLGLARQYDVMKPSGMIDAVLDEELRPAREYCQQALDAVHRFEGSIAPAELKELTAAQPDSRFSTLPIECWSTDRCPCTDKEMTALAKQFPSLESAGRMAGVLALNDGLHAELVPLFVANLSALATKRGAPAVVGEYYRIVGEIGVPPHAQAEEQIQRAHDRMRRAGIAGSDAELNALAAQVRRGSPRCSFTSKESIAAIHRYFHAPAGKAKEEQ